MEELEEPEKPESRTQEQYKKYRMKAFSVSFVVCLLSEIVSNLTVELVTFLYWYH